MLNKDMLKGGGIALFIMLFFGVIYAAGFHYPSEIVPGGFQDGSYWFNGNLGIGTINPSNNLHLSGYDKQIIFGVELTNNYKFKIRAGGAANGWNEGVQIGSESNHDLTFIANNKPQITIKPNGNIGIGTIAPQDVLHIAGSARLSKSGTNSVFRIADSTETVKILLDSASDSYIMGGNVGIGTTNPEAMLDVNGSWRLDGYCFDAGEYDINGVSSDTWYRFNISFNKNFISPPIVNAIMHTNEGLNNGHDCYQNQEIGGIDSTYFEFDFYACGSYSLNSVLWMAWGKC
jgi:hypothetical protein